MTNVFLTPLFDAPDPSGEQGACEDWERVSFQKYPGFAAFKQPHGFLAPNERFQWEDSPARIAGSEVEPFALPAVAQWVLPVAGVVVAPTNTIQFANVDLRAALPPGGSLRVVGVSPNTQMDGYWTVVSVALVGADSHVAVAEDVFAMAPGADARLAPVIECTACDHAWAPSVVDTTAYPVAPLGAGQTLIVRVDRGAPQTIAFLGGETTADDVATVIDELLAGGGARVVGGQVEIFSDTVGPAGSLQVETGTAALTFDADEVRGRGQWAHMWAPYFANPTAAIAAEVVEVLDAHWAHVRSTRPGSASGDPVHLATDRRGATATLAVDDPQGGFYDAAAWPIAARTPGVDDAIDFQIDGTLAPVLLSVTDVTPELVAARIAAAFLAAPVDASTAWTTDRVYVDSRLDLVCLGGTANADLGFPVGLTTYGGGAASETLGLRGTTAGVTDVGWFDTFADVTAIFAEFAGGSPVAGTAETFTWDDIFATMDATTSIPSAFCSWYGVLSGNPALWPAAVDTFDEAWASEWLSSYHRATPVAGAWKPPGVSPAAALVGTALTFPLTVTGNRNRLAIYSETDIAWYVLSVTPGIYTTLAALVVNLNTQLTACGITDAIEFSAYDDAVALGWDGTAASDGAFHLGAPALPLTDNDARPTLGLHPLASEPGAARIDVPAGVYAGSPVATWDADDSYGVDPYARLIFDTVQDPALGTWQAISNGDLPALFNALDPVIADSYVEAFAWWTPIAAGAYVGWPLATFDAAIAPETFEDFEEGW